MEQLSIFSTDLQIGHIINCGNCICHYGPQGPCEHWERYDSPCPEAMKRTSENPDSDIHSDWNWHNRSCCGCARSLPIPGTKIHTGNWRGYVQHRFFCESYMPTTATTKQCLKYPITVYKSDNKMICAYCEANGCEDCYRDFMKDIDEEE